MSIVRFKVARCVGLFVLLGACAQRNDEGSFPARNISIIVPFKPGGGFDLQARLLAPFLEKLPTSGGLLTSA